MISERHGRHLLQYAGMLLIILTLNFALPRLMPGNPMALLAGVDVGLLTPEEREEIRVRAGLDQPIVEQYVSYVGAILTGDFGYSYRQNRPISTIILERLPFTLLLTITALAVSALAGILLGAIAAWKRASRIDVGLLNGMILLDALPSFWLGMMFISIFAVNLGWLPSQGARTPASGYEGLTLTLDVLRHAVLPVITLSLLSTPRVFLTMRAAMCSVLGADFIRTAQAKGLSQRYILLNHLIPNALVPVVTVLALRFGYSFGGTVVIETVFSYPGLGRLIFEAVSGRDYPVMQAAFLLFTVAVLFSNLLADWLYPRLDPRARAG